MLRRRGIDYSSGYHCCSEAERYRTCENPNEARQVAVALPVHDSDNCHFTDAYALLASYLPLECEFVQETST
jgi:hypothetical protein